MSNGRRLDIGVCAYGTPDLLERCLESIRRHSVTDYRIIVWDNPHPQTGYAFTHRTPQGTPGLVHLTPNENIGYAGAVAEIQQRAETEYIAYLDHDTEIQTPGWDEALCALLDRHHEVGMAFPNGGSMPIDRGDYHEIMWAPGFCWVLNRLCQSEVGLFDTTLGHQEEADYALRVRMAGWKCAALPGVHVAHLARATNEQSPASIERISAGIRRWVDKWAATFGGKNINYHSPNVLRWEDWGCNRLYLEEYFKLRLPNLNDAPEVITLDGVEYDLIKVPRLKGFYGNRII